MSNPSLQATKEQTVSAWRKLARQEDRRQIFATSSSSLEMNRMPRCKSEIQFAVKTEIAADSESYTENVLPTVATLPGIHMKKIIRLDVNKVKKKEATSERETSSGENPKNFRDVVKTAMIVRNWMSSQNQTTNVIERQQISTAESTIFEPPSVAPEDAPILVEPHAIIPENPSGLKILRSRVKDAFMKLKLFAVSPSGAFYYYWSFIVFLGVLYNMLGMVIFIFDDVYNNFFWHWFAINIFFDFIYLLDILISSRKIYTDDGMEVKSLRFLWRNYRMESIPFIKNFMFRDREYGGRMILDFFVIIPLDLYLFINNSISLVRTVKILKVHRFMDFVELGLKKSTFPHATKIFFLMLACYILFHWNACVYFLFSLSEGLSEEDTNAFGFSYYKVFDPRLPTCNIWEDEGCLMKENYDVMDLDEERPKYLRQSYEFWYNKSKILVMGNFSREYSMSMYWSALTITTCGQQPYPSSSPQNMLEVVDTLIGVLVFATIIGSVGNVVTQMNKAVYDYRLQMDAIKFYMKYRFVSDQIQDRVLKCFMYMNSKHQLTDEKDVLECLPPRMQGNIAESLHMETLNGVSLFTGCDQGFLDDVVLLMKQQVFMPNDILCKVGDKAKEMFIVKSGVLEVIDESNNVLQEMTDGGTFGEMSIIQIKGNPMGDRRQSGLRSVGYSDVYILNQDDVLPLLSEYPDERHTLTKNAHRWLNENEMLPEGQESYESIMIDSPVMFSLEEQLEQIRAVVTDIDAQLDGMYSSFRTNTNSMKKRVTSLEETMWYSRDRIRKDMFLGKL